MNGAYIPKSNYSLSFDSSNKVTVTNLGHSSYPWVEGWELTFLVTRIVVVVEQEVFFYGSNI